MISTVSDSISLQSESASKKFIPVIKIKYNGPGTLSLSTSNSAIIINSISFPYEGKNIDELISTINTYFPDESIKIHKVLDIGSDMLRRGSLIYTSGDITSDYYLIRYIGIVYRYNENSNISIKPPTATNHLESWYPKITKGSFNARFSNSNFTSFYGINANTIYTFGIPEYKYQDWSVKYGPPYKDVIGERPRVLAYDSKIGRSVIKLSNKPIYWKNNISILIRGTYQNNSFIRHVDANNGLIYLNYKIDSSVPVTVDYTYIENDYVYDAIDLNISLTHNPLVSDKYIAFYLTPINSTNAIISSPEKGIFHEIVDTNLEGKIKTARIIKSTKGTNNPIYEPIIYLGSINIRQSENFDRIEVIDTRSRGGGLYEDTVDAFRSNWRHSEFFWDVNPIDGIPIPGNAGIVITLPTSIKNSYSKDLIRDRASKDVALGVVPIFDGLD